jgi:hypothetical protein
MAGFHGGAAFRFTSLLALELKLAYYLDVLGAYPIADGSSYRFDFFQGSLGVSLTLPYGALK